MMNTPFFSLLIPVYNAERALDACLQSIMNQNFLNFEVVLVDDGSTDNSFRQCTLWQERYPNRIRVLRQENSGAVYARRKLLLNARGTYLWFVDADDDIAPNALQTLYALLQAQAADMVLFDWAAEDKNGNWAICHQLSQQLANHVFTAEDKPSLYRYAVEGRLNSLCNKLFHRNCIDFDADYSAYRQLKKGNDRLQMLPLLTAARSVLYAPVVLYRYHYSAGGLTATFGPHSLEGILIGLQHVEQYMEKWGGSSLYRKEFALLKNRHVYQLLTQAFDACKVQDGYRSFRTYFSLIASTPQLMADYRYLPYDAIDCYARGVTRAVRCGNALYCYWNISARKALHRIKSKLTQKRIHN